MNFGQWVSSGWNNATLVDGYLRTYSDTEGFRGASVLLDSSVLSTGSGTYTLSFDLVGVASSGNLPANHGDSAAVSIWSGTGYNTGNTWPNQLIVSTGTAELQGNGATTVTKVAEQKYTTAGSYNINFDYSGSGAIAIFIGAYNTGGWPHTYASYDNVSVSNNIPVASRPAGTPAMSATPEVSVASVLPVLLLSGSLLHRRRRA
ncbi:hypothetical protein OKA04_11510 [Luteolibacter flavescens]|uniref:PEP-CTERM sorting domain-containing protein n=1 Tax=Luteolibacter flavescens TaxID=1859460 RepID=A0ABT3FP60_9BACT|nr:hypothetical protein [Luteolibacter flavescens]